MEEIKLVVAKWINFRETWKAKKGVPMPGEITEFKNAATAISRELMGVIGNNSAEFYEALGEIALHAQADITHPELMR